MTILEAGYYSVYPPADTGSKFALKEFTVLGERKIVSKFTNKDFKQVHV